MIFLASDHRGFELKEDIKRWLEEWGIEYKDMGPAVYDADDDYPEFVSKAARGVSDGDSECRAIVLGHSGQGEAVVANKYPRVRAVVYYGGPDDILRSSREHNDANVLSIGASFVDRVMIKSQIKRWLERPFSGEERHVRRLDQIKSIEKSQH